jgi:FAD-dependent urate hydroxylase
VSAHLRARGLRVQTFGQPMSFWERHMPAGMLLRSAWGASSLSDPRASLTLDAYEAEQPQPFSRPLPGVELARYGRWFAGRAVPDLDHRLVRTVERTRDGFAVELEDSERLTARRVVVATGLARFAQRPAPFDDLPDPVAVHAVHVTEPQRYAGLSVVVVGSGQSAVETAALVHEAGADVELLARAPAIRWLVRGERVRASSALLRRLLYAPTDVGPAGLSWVMATPELFRRLPLEPRERLAYRSIRPAATSWLVDRTAAVTMTLGRQVISARPDAGAGAGGASSDTGETSPAVGDGRTPGAPRGAPGTGAHLTLDDGSERRVDRVILATGYRVDAAREPLLGESIRGALRLDDGYPLLGPGFESSIPGLHFVGAYSARSFGPIMRFVSGTPFTARALAGHVARAGAPTGAHPGSAPARSEPTPQTAAQD